MGFGEYGRSAWEEVYLFLLEEVAKILGGSRSRVPK